MKYYILIFLSIHFSLIGQIEQFNFGGEIITHDTINPIGHFKLTLTPTQSNTIKTNFFILSKNHEFAGFEIGRDTITCSFQDIKNTFTYKLGFRFKPNTTIGLKCTGDSTYWQIEDSIKFKAVVQTKFSTSKIHIFLSKSPLSPPHTNTIDTSIAEIYKYEQSTTGTTLSDDFSTYKKHFWDKSNTSYVENLLRLDSAYVVHDQNKIQLIALSGKKTWKSIFKKENKPNTLPTISHITYLDGIDGPSIKVIFKDTIYSKDKNVKNFRIEGTEILKSKLKSDYKTVIIKLSKPLTRDTTLHYQPIIGRYRKRQSYLVKAMQ